MARDDYQSTYLSQRELEGIAERWREWLDLFILSDALRVKDFFEAAGFRLKRRIEVIVLPDDQAGRISAFVGADRCKVFFSQTVFEGAMRGDRQSVFVCIHELGHLIIHNTGQSHARMSDGNIKAKSLVGIEFESVEYQADYFARAFLMTAEELQRYPGSEELAEGCKVPTVQAIQRLKEFKRLYSLVPAARGEDLALRTEALKFDLWTRCSPIHEKDPDEFRSFGGLWCIRWSRYQMSVPGGWRISRGIIVPWELECGA